ncbi:MAG: metalloregulator ArsR/SmtB family transcription factor [Acidobacteriota bacterium]
MTARPPILDYAAQLAEPTRCRLLRLLDAHELSVSELCRVLQMPQSTVSRHLKVLVEGGWIDVRREGTRHVYRPAVDLDDGAQRLWRLVREEIGHGDTALQDRRRLEAVLAERRARSREFFSSSAVEWDRMRDELFGSRFDLEALLGLLDPTWTVGDLGCGTGRVAAALAPHVGGVVAVDESPEMLTAAAARLAARDDVDLRRGELEALPIDDASLDAATLILTLHHAADPTAVLAEARRTLRPAGRLLVVDMQPHDREDYRRTMGHVWLGFSADDLRAHAAAAGLVGLRVRPLAADADAQGPALFVATAGAPPPS